MADVIVSKIQHRRGLRRDLPQPLDPGELGYCTDTGQVFIGAEKPTDDQYSLHSLSVILYDNEVSLENVANRIIRENLVQYDYDYQFVPEFDEDDADTLVAQINADLQSRLDGIDYAGHDAVVTRDEKGNWYARGYVVYKVSPADITLGYTDTEALASYFADASGIAFNRGSLDLQLSDVEYTLDDSYAIAELMNLVHGNGLVTTQQNIEMLTDFSDLAGLSTPRAEITLPEDSTDPVLSYDLVESDSFVIEYSLYDTTGQIYSRVGRLKIVTLGGTAMLLDDYSEMTESSVSVDFTSDIDNNKVNVYYTTTSNLEFIFTTNTRKWKSF